MQLNSCKYGETQQIKVCCINCRNSSIMYELHMGSIFVNNLVKYSVYHPVAGEVCWDVEMMKSYFLPLSPLLAIVPLFCP